MKLHPLLLSSAILDLVKRFFEKINNLDVCFCFLLLTACQSITDELRETECLGQASLDSGETRVVDCDGFARALPTDGGLSGPSFHFL